LPVYLVNKSLPSTTCLSLVKSLPKRVETGDSLPVYLVKSMPSWIKTQDSLPVPGEDLPPRIKIHDCLLVYSAGIPSHLKPILADTLGLP
jgi:hypothetical protein